MRARTKSPNHGAQVSSPNFLHFSPFQIEPAEFAPERLVLVCSLQVNSHASQRDSAPKSARFSPVVVQSTRESVDWPTFGPLPRLAPACTAHAPWPRTACHVCIMQPRLMQCARQMLHSPTIHHKSLAAFHWALATMQSISPIAFPAAGSFYANVRVLTGQVVR